MVWKANCRARPLVLVKRTDYAKRIPPPILVENVETITLNNNFLGIIRRESLRFFTTRCELADRPARRGRPKRLQMIWGSL